MKRTQITIKNYRGFSDSEPVRFEIGPGFTALVGRNNSGKSSSKLFFYELRNVFQTLTGAGGSPGLSNLFGGSFLTQYLGITDISELFNNTNSRPLSVEIEIVEALTHTNYLRRIVGICDRERPQVWNFQAFSSTHPTTNLNGAQFQSPRAINHGPQGLVDINDMIVVLEALRDARYYGPFRNAINQGSGDHFDLRIGTSFIDLWNEWKTSGIKAKTRSIDKVTEEIRTLFEFGRLEINASVPLRTLIVSVDGQPYRLGELGSGLAQFIIVLGNAATTRPSLLLIDEPETNLHPALQIDFLLAVAHYAKYGCVFSTHSVGLARSVAEHIYSFQKEGQKTIVRPFEVTPHYLEFVGELSFSAFKEMGCDRILLVEGVNDVKTVQQLLRLVNKEHTTVILPLGGDQLASGGREVELHELTRLSNNIFALVDSERTIAEAQPSKRRIEFEETCSKLKFGACITERRAIENYFPDHAVKAALGSSYQALGDYEVLRDSTNPWSKSESWKIARQMSLEDFADTDIGAFLQRI